MCEMHTYPKIKKCRAKAKVAMCSVVGSISQELMRIMQMQQLWVGCGVERVVLVAVGQQRN
jgi:hypothetical protein